MTGTIGILGGMGPEAGAKMLTLIIENTKAETDQDHIPVILNSNPKIPPRTDAILGNAPSPLPFLVNGLKVLKQAGADFIVIPCITVHYFLPEALKEIDIPVINLLEESFNWTSENLSGIKKAGLIASPGTLKTGLFQNVYSQAHIQLLTPEEEEQENVMAAIFGPEGIKAGNTDGSPKEMIVNTARILAGRGAEAIIAGCTEIPLVLKERDIPVPLIEPMTITARAAIQKAGYSLR